MHPIFHPHRLGAAVLIVALGLVGCSEVEVSDYEAIAIVTYTWQVEYAESSDRPFDTRRETFASTSLTNRNGQEPGDAVTGPDDQELWWPALPPRPTLSEMEARQTSSQETVSAPQLLKQVEYTLTYTDGGQTVTGPTDFDVYRQAVRALRQGQSLRLTLGVDDRTVEKATPIP